VSKINDFEKLPEPRGSHFAAFDELVTMKPQIFKVSPEEYAHLEKLLAEPPKVNERLRRLLKGETDD
jgi:uncharacterized protein (DUF1778 family)